MVSLGPRVGDKDLELGTSEGVSTRIWGWRLAVGVSGSSTLGSSGGPVWASSEHRNQSSVHLLEGLMLKLELQYFGYQIRRADAFQKTLMFGKIEGGRGRGRQRMRWLDGITDTWT